MDLKMWTFEATATRGTGKEKCEVWVWAGTEEAARIKAKKKVYETIEYGPDRVDVGRLVNVE